MADALEVHPAAILVAALIGANLIGITGMILAAPVLATLQVLFRYMLSKLFDRNPWEGIDFINHKKQGEDLPILIRKVWTKVQNMISGSTTKNNTDQPSQQSAEDGK
jgi:H+/gluconate symporter-like permease